MTCSDSAFPELVVAMLQIPQCYWDGLCCFHKGNPVTSTSQQQSQLCIAHKNAFFRSELYQVHLETYLLRLY